MKSSIKYWLSRSNFLFRISKIIVDQRRNENNSEIESNGEFNFITSNKDKFAVIFDVGANTGEWTNLVSKFAPAAVIHSFEPSHQTFQTLSKNVTSSKVSLHNIGLGDKNETKELFTYGTDSTLNSAFSREIDAVQKQQSEIVSFKTLDSFCTENHVGRISFLKIDTEGNELSVLHGAQQYVGAGKIDMIQFEYGGTYIQAGILLKDVFKYFENKPYTISKILQGGLWECPKYSESLENFQYANYVAVLKKIT